MEKKYQDAFDTLKEKFNIFFILRPFNCSLSFHVLCDTSLVVVRRIFYQASGKKSKNYLIAFDSRQLNLTKKNYTIIV